jgi:hypothetical protein
MPYDILIQLIMTFVSMGVAIFALRGFRWVKEKSLYYLYLSFTILAIGFFAEGLTLGYDYIVRSGGPGAASPMFIDLGFVIYYCASMLAYGILVYAYFKNVRDASIAAALFGMFLMSTTPLMESLIIVLLFAIFFAQLIHLSIRTSKNSIIVCSTFGLIFASHILVLISDSGVENFYVAGKILQLIAFSILLAMLMKVRKPE